MRCRRAGGIGEIVELLNEVVVHGMDGGGGIRIGKRKKPETDALRRASKIENK
ncbi:hypothetical protein N9B32_03255 [Akkermansiaceae bacterium]|nr:hypothetical protein [Akkermansiaceae bacterium]